MLIVLLPFAGAETPAPENATNVTVTPGAFELDVVVPPHSRSAVLTIEGKTRPSAIVHAFVNNIRVRVVTAAADGRFKLPSIPLSQPENTLRIEADVNRTIVRKEFKVLYDSAPPTVKLDKDIPDSVKEGSLKITGDVNEKVTILYRVIHRSDLEPPELIANLKATKVDENAVELTWDPNTATDFREYLIIRNGKRLATTALTSFRDENVVSGKEYGYSIAAVDTSCNTGTSADVSITTKSGGATNITQALYQVNLSCEPAFSTMSAGSPFSITLTLAEGINDIEMLFIDSTGNQEVITKTVRMDNRPPKFIETNLKELSPSYTPRVKIKGKLDEQATVFVYLNDEKKPSKFEVTEKDGSFTIPIDLRTERRIKKGVKRAALEVGEGWVNTIKLEAVDLGGNKGTHGPADVDFLLCGEGTWWRTNIGEPLPTILLPRLLIQGVQQIGIPFNISYIGNYPVRIGKIDVRPIPLSKEAQKDYDHDWVSVQEYTRPRGPKDTVGYVQIQFENVQPLVDKPEAGPNEKELAVSGHRRGECIVPGTGCVKLFLQMEIQFQETIQLKPTDPRMPIATPKIEKRIQRVCVPVEVAIDQTIPSDVIPKGLLRNALKIIDKAINLIDKVLKPLTTIGEYVLYGCLASNVWLFVSFFQEKMACEASAVFAAFGDGGWNKAVAEAGICEQAYKDNPTKLSSCQNCQKTLESRKKFENNVMHGLCDRVACPSAPTFATYIRDQSGIADPLDVSSEVQKNDAAFFTKWALTTGNQQALYAGNDCAFTYSTFDFITPTYKSSGNKVGIRALFDIAKGQPTTEAEAGLPLKLGPTTDDCKKELHPAHPNCCGVQYQREWSSACGIGTVLGTDADTFDELKESTCLAAQKANVATTDLTCNRLWNSVAGFCESKTGEPSAETVNLGAVWAPPKTGADDNAAYIFIIPAAEVAGRPLAGLVSPRIIPGIGGATTPQYRVFRGYAVKTPQFDRIPREEKEKRGPKGQFRLNAGLTAVFDKELTHHFVQGPPTDEKKPKVEDAKRLQDFATDICEGITPCEKAGNVKNSYERVREFIETPEDEYIVRPYSGLLRSTQCVCLPAVTSYLHMWRSVLGAFHACFSKILLTGEGSEGFCAAKLSGVVCDLFFEFISCFTQKFSTPGVGGRAGLGGFGDVLGALTGAGTAVSRSVSNRYGETSLYKSLFSERKLVHAICIWAFTGTWDLNIQNLFQQQVEEIPVDSEGALTTCQRTFVSYDPTTEPSGLTSWAYRIAGGMIAGADLRYRLKLKCSSGFACDPQDYPDGKCDCPAQEFTLPVTSPELGRGQARKFELLNFDSTFLVQPQQDPLGSGVRYDTAILEWEWTDPRTKTVRTDKVDCSIRQTEGGGAPAFCALDLFSGKFRCLFGEMESGIRINEAKPAYPENQEAFALTQPLNFALDIKQKYPEERRLQRQSKKFLTYDIKDANGVTIVDQETGKELRIQNDAVNAQYDLATNGVYRFVVPQPGARTAIEDFKLNNPTIIKHSAVAAAGGIRQTPWGINVRKDFAKRVTITDSDNKPVARNIRLLIVLPKFKDQQGEAQYEVYLVNPAAPEKLESNSRNGYLSFTTDLLATGQQASGLLNQVSFKLKVPRWFGDAEFNGFLEFEHITGYQPIGDSLQILVEYVPPQERKETPGCPQEQVTWTAVFTIYDSDRQGNPSEQVSVDPETGEAQQRVVPFKIICKKPEEIKIAPIVSPAIPQLESFTLLDAKSTIVQPQPDGSYLLNGEEQYKARFVVKFNQKNFNLALVSEIWKDEPLPVPPTTQYGDTVTRNPQDVYEYVFSFAGEKPGKLILTLTDPADAKKQSIKEFKIDVRMPVATPGGPTTQPSP